MIETIGNSEKNVLQSCLLCDLFGQQISDHNITQVIIKELYCLYISSYFLYVLHYNVGMSSVTFENIIAIVSLNNIQNHFAAVTKD